MATQPHAGVSLKQLLAAVLTRKLHGVISWHNECAAEHRTNIGPILQYETG